MPRVYFKSSRFYGEGASKTALVTRSSFWSHITHICLPLVSFSMHILKQHTDAKLIQYNSVLSDSGLLVYTGLYCNCEISCVQMRSAKN